MSVNHRERIETIVDKALKEASLGEPYGYVVDGPGMWGMPMPDGKTLSDPIPAWFIIVTIRGAGLGDPDIGNGCPVPGILPGDEDFRFVARGILEQCRNERQQANMAAFAAGPSMKLSERPAQNGALR